MPKSKSGKSRRSKSSKGSKRSKKSGKQKKKKDDEPEAEAAVDEGDTESMKQRKRKKKSKGSKDSGKGSDGSDTSKKRRKKKRKPGDVDAEGAAVPEGEAAAEGDSDSLASEPSEKTSPSRSRSAKSASAGASTSAFGGGGDAEDGRAEIHFRGMYRKWAGVKDYSALLNPVYKAFQRFWPWPPRKSVFFTSGYYFDWDDGEGDLKDNELMIHNIPPGTPESEIKKEFPSATRITLNPDGTAKIEFDTPASATNAYNNSKLVKLGNRHLKWVRPDELYVLGVPNNVNADDIISDLPNGTGVSFEDGPDGNLIATVKFRTPPDADKAYDDAPYKKLGNHQLGFSSGNNPIKLTNIPPGIGDDEIKKRFPTAKKVENKGNGTAKVYFENDDDAGKSYDDSDMVKLGKPKLGWLRPEELYVVDVPKDATEKDFLKQFPKAKRVKFQNGEGGTRIATVIFPNEAEQKKAFDDSDWTKLGPQKLKFGGFGGKGKGKGDGGGGGGGGGGGKGNLQLSNVPQGVTEAELKKRFPKASGVKIEKGTGNVKIQFKNGDDLNQAYEDSDLVKLGKPKLGWIRPEELYVEGIPGNVGEDELMKQFPKAKRINWLKGDGGRRIAQVVFPNEEDQKSSYEDSDYTKLGPQKLGYKRPEKPMTGVDQSDADMLAKWELAAKGFSNISNLFSGDLLVSGLPPHIKGTDLLKLIPGATSVDFTKGKKGQAHVIFNDPAKAAHAFGVAKNVEFDGHKITVHIMKGGGGRSKGGKKKGGGKGSSKTSSKTSSGKSKK